MALFSAESIRESRPEFRRNLINSVTGFKSVTLIGSVDPQGVTNLAIFSQVVHLGADPPLIGVIFRPHTVIRHTLENILATGCFTINHFTEQNFREAHHTSARWEQSEFEACGFQPEYINGFLAPFVKEAPIQIGLKFEEKHDFHINGTHMVIGSIQHLHIPDEAIGTDGFIDLESMSIVTCSGLDSYHTTKKQARLAYAKPDRIPEDLH